MSDEPEITDTQTLSSEVEKLQSELAIFNSSLFMRSQRNIWGLMSFHLVRGLAFGLGSVVGATILVSVLVYLLSNIDFLPIVGDWAREIADMIRVTEP